MSNTRLTQSGFAAIAAIFLIVVLAALGAFMVTMSNTQQLTSTQDLQGTRAYWAARAGLEWGVNRTFITNACPAASSALGAIQGFSVTVTCTVAAYSDAGLTTNLFRITSVASTGTPGGIGYVERSVSVGLER
jgi:MSHA biogenesis protein MshP